MMRINQWQLFFDATSLFIAMLLVLCTFYLFITYIVLVGPTHNLKSKKKLISK